MPGVALIGIEIGIGNGVGADFDSDFELGFSPIYLFGLVVRLLRALHLEQPPASRSET